MDKGEQAMYARIQAWMRGGQPNTVLAGAAMVTMAAAGTCFLLRMRGTATVLTASAVGLCGLACLAGRGKKK